MKIALKLAVVLAVLTFGSAGFSQAQQAPAKAKTPARAAPSTPALTSPQADPAKPAAPDAPTSAGWAARCSSASREAPLECAMEQTAVLSKTGQLIVLVNIRITSDTRSPVAMVQLPLGLNLPGGAKFQVDDGKTVDLQIQTCESRGCYAGTSIAPDFLAAMRTGQQLKVSFQNLGKETITIPMPLADFATAYDKIK